MVAFGLEYIIIFVLNFPAGTTIAHNGFDGRFLYFKICAERIFVNDLTRLFVYWRKVNLRVVKLIQALLANSVCFNSACVG